VTPGSPAANLGIKPGDVLQAVDGRPLRDELDFLFYTSGDTFELTVHSSEGSTRSLLVERRDESFFGVEFEDPLFDGLRLCANHCSFCFVRQMPPGFRPTLYVRDDDYRLSFLHGSFITLTNLEPSDWYRLAEQRLSPLYVSVHATEPEVRRRLLGSREHPPILERLRWLRDHRIAFHAQLVLVPGVNDGEHLDRSLGDLLELGESCLSVSVVPVGLTRCAPAGRRRFNAAEAGEVIAQVTQWRRRYHAAIGRRTVYASDEWFLLRGTDLPLARYYEDFSQVENGVGLVRLFLDAWEADRDRLAAGPVPHDRRTVVCGTLIAATWEQVAAEMRALGAGVVVQPVTNYVLGPSVTVSGLLCGADVVQALESRADGVVCLPRSMFDAAGKVTLDGLTVEELSCRIGAPVLMGTEAADVLAPLPARRSEQ